MAQKELYTSFTTRIGYSTNFKYKDPRHAEWSGGQRLHTLVSQATPEVIQKLPHDAQNQALDMIGYSPEDIPRWKDCIIEQNHYAL